MKHSHSLLRYTNEKNYIVEDVKETSLRILSDLNFDLKVNPRSILLKPDSVFFKSISLCVLTGVDKAQTCDSPI